MKCNDKPVITNWDKVKEEVDMNECYGFVECICKAIKRIRNIKYCGKSITCRECYEWLKQPYKEPSILDEVEKKYLSDVIRPWRDKVKCIKKVQPLSGTEERIFIRIKNDDLSVVLPRFSNSTMYKGMKQDKEYTLDELEL